MKKYFLSLVAIAAMLFATSCQESLVEPQIEGPTTFSVQLPDQMGTKAFGDEASTNQTINKLYVQVYDESGNNSLVKLEPISVKTAGTAAFEFSLDLVRGAKYDIILWAQNENAKYNVGSADSDLRSIWMTDQHHNSELGAAFYAIINNYDPEKDADRKQDVVLTRPFAQLNIGTELTSDHGELTLVESKVTVAKAAGKLERVAGEEYMVGTGNETTFTYTSSTYKLPTTTEPLKVAGKNYAYVSMDYLAVLGDTKSLVDVTVEIKLKDKFDNLISLERRIESVPVQMNYRTNIVGNLISSTTDFNVVVDDKFVDENGDNVSDDYNMLIWDGESIKVPSYDETTSTYSISNGAELAWLAATVSGDPLTRSGNEPKSLAGKTIKLTEDIYLADNEWKPIGMGGKHFEGIFDGQGHTIYGLKVSSRNSEPRAALFCSAAGNAQFKNFTIDGANIIYPKDGEDYYAAAVVGTIYGNITFENITVKNSSITGNNKIGALLGHDGKSSQVTVKDCHVLDSYIASEDLKDGGCVGGMIGYLSTIMGNMSHSSVKNCEIVGINSRDRGDRANSQFIGSILTNDAMVLNITNCVLEDNTFTQTINGTDPVTYQSAFIPQYIGGDRQEQTKGKINITFDGKNVIADGVAQDAEGNYYVSNAAGLRWVSENVNTMEYYVNKSANIFDEKTVYLAADIDLKGQEWRPIGDYAFSRTSFNGIFDGQGHTISNFKVTNKVNWSEKVTEASYGLFGNVKGIIKNVTVEDAIVNPDGGCYSGVLVGRLHDGGLIENCHVVNSSVTINHWQVGGILGQNNNGNIKDCSIIESTVTGMAAVGAIVGMDMTEGEHRIENCCVKNTSLVQNGSFGESYDASYGLAVGLVNKSNIILHLNNIKVENNKIKGEDASTLVGDKAVGAAIYVNGAIPVSTADELVNALKANENVMFLNDIIVDEWIMFSEDYNIGDGTIITIDEINVTIDGKGHTLTVKAIESAGNNDQLFQGASNLNISDLTIKYADGLTTGGLGMVSGIIKNVHFVGGGASASSAAIFPGNGVIKVEDCIFDTNGVAFYFDDECDNLTVTGCTFNQKADKNVILLRGDVKFTNNIINSGRTVNIVSGSPYVYGNDFKNVRLKVYPDATARVEKNIINNLVFETTYYSSEFVDNTLSTSAEDALKSVTKVN